ncbi:MAG: NAD-dependent epimerase/dehydratase family protein [Pseudonocardiaceae bacterium]
MKVLVLGGDGYLGWPQALHLSARDHEVDIVDNFLRRRFDLEHGLDSLAPITSLHRRVQRWRAETALDIGVHVMDITDHGGLARIFAEVVPDAVVHFGEQRSAPYSMIDRGHAVHTQVNNVVGTLNLLRTWGVRTTDLHQGIVYGATTDETSLHPDLSTRLDYDHVYGTALNRFCVQAALGQPITLYGRGGQARGYIDIRDTMRCVELAIANPADAGEYRVFNQITEQFRLHDIADRVATTAAKRGVNTTIVSVPNPRVEAEDHHFNVVHTRLEELGLKPHLLDDPAIDNLLDLAVCHLDRVDPTVIEPRIDWRRRHNTVRGNTVRDDVR